MCGILITWCIGRNNNGPIGPNNQVRGANVNTRVVKLLPVDKKDDKKAEEERERQGGKEPEPVVDREQEVRSLDDAQK